MKPCKIGPRGNVYLTCNPKTHDGYRYLHRYVYAMHYKVQLTENDYVLHKCDNPGCTEITHLFLGNADINNKDKAAKGRASRLFKLTIEQIRRIEDLYEYDGYTQSELAAMFNVSRPYISKVINSKIVPRP